MGRRMALFSDCGVQARAVSDEPAFAEPVKLTSGRRSRRPHQHPAFGGDSSGGRNQSSTRACASQMIVRSAHLDPAGLIRLRGFRMTISSYQAALRLAPSGTTPVIANLHRLISNLRANATIRMRLFRPPTSAVRLLNQTERADVG